MDGLNKIPGWINEQIWPALKSYWETDEFIALSEQNKKNRVSSKGDSLHTCDSVSMATHRARLEAEKGTSSDIEIYCFFHNVFDENGNVSKWVEPRAQQVDEKYKAFYQEWFESQGSGVDGGDPKPNPEEETAMFIEAAGGYTSKNRAYGLGPAHYKDPSRIGIVNSYASSSSSCGQDNVDPAVQAKFDEMERRFANEGKELEKKLADQDQKMAKFEEWFSTYGPGMGYEKHSQGRE